MLDKKLDKILISNDEIKVGIQKAADWINETYKGKKVLFLGILKGCIPFFGEIITKINLDCEIDFMSANSFHGGTSASTEPLLKLDVSVDVKDKEIIILEDIIDTARTLSKIVQLLESRGAKKVSIVTLLDKREKRLVNLHADYSCFVIPDLFIVGFGLDYQEELRNIPHIYTVKDNKDN